MKKVLTLQLVIVCFIFTSYGQLFVPDFEVNTISPPEIYLHGVEKIAILNFEDESSENYSYWSNKMDHGAKLADYMTTKLLQEDRGQKEGKNTYFDGFNTRFYTVIERNKLNEILKEQDLGMSGTIDEAQAVKVGKILGLDAIILGSVSRVTDEGTYSKKHKRKDGSIYYTYYAKREVKAEARMKIIAVETGEIISMTTKSGTKSDEVKSDGLITVASTRPEEELANLAYNNVADQLVDFFTPHYRYLELNLRKIRAREFKTRGKEILSFISEDRIDKALLLAKELYAEDPYNTNIVYNMGALYEGTGNYSEAQKAYSIAYELDPDNADSKQALERLNGVLELNQYLAELGMIITPYEFQTEGSAVADRVTTSGRKKDRIAVYTQMDPASVIAAKVPGDTQFEIIEDAGEWYLIKLIGGKQGYLNKVDAKN